MAWCSMSRQSFSIAVEDSVEGRNEGSSGRCRLHFVSRDQKSTVRSHLRLSAVTAPCDHPDAGGLSAICPLPSIPCFRFQRSAEASSPYFQEGAPQFWRCDGPCTTSLRTYHELHFCWICNDTCFCEECLKLLKENKLPYRHCSVGHDWVQTYPIPEGTNDLAASIREGYVEIHQEWLSKLQEQWTRS